MPDSAALATNAWRDAIGPASSENTVAAPNIPNRHALDQIFRTTVWTDTKHAIHSMPADDQNWLYRPPDNAFRDTA
jgi:hypothetical protein